MEKVIEHETETAVLSRLYDVLQEFLKRQCQESPGYTGITGTCLGDNIGQNSQNACMSTLRFFRDLTIAPQKKCKLSPEHAKMYICRGILHTPSTRKQKVRTGTVDFVLDMRIYVWIMCVLV